MNPEIDFINEFNDYLSGISRDAVDGYYNIDGSSENMHVYKRFIVALKQTGNTCTLYFVDAQCYDDRKYCNPGDVYASTETLSSQSDTTEILLNEVRGGKRIAIAYDFVLGDHRFQLTTKEGKRKYTDHFIKITSSEIYKDISFSKMEYRIPNHEETQTLDFEYQAGLELMFWLSKLEATKLDTDLILKSLNIAFDSLSKTKNYPIAEYNSVWHATFGLSIVFANILISESDWQWIFLEKSPDIDMGWTLVSKDKKLGIRVEQIFYERIIRQEAVDFIDFYKNVKSSISTTKLNEGRIVMLELACK